MICPGSKTPDIYRKKIRTAIKEKDKSALEKVINSSIALGMSELDSEILQAKKALKRLKRDFKGYIHSLFNYRTYQND